MKTLKSIVLSLAGFALCFVLMDYGVGLFFEWAIAQLPAEGERVAKSEYVLNRVEADVVVLGSSRAESHYDCSVIKQYFPDFSVFNCGVDGQQFYYTCAVFNSIMDRYTPKIIIWDFSNNDLGKTDVENLTLLYPHYSVSDFIRLLLDKHDAKLRFALMSNCYKYSGTASRIIRAMFLSESHNMGFVARPTKNRSVGFVADGKYGEFSPIVAEKADMLSSCFKRAHDAGTTICVCASPSYVKFDGISPTIEFLKNESEKYGFVFFDGSILPDFIRKDEYWYDSRHLNVLGAEEYSRIVMRRFLDDGK